VSIGIDHDTASFAVNAIRCWWQRMGRARYPQARRLLITADCGGSNGLWKRELPRHQQTESDRASSVLIHHAELAWQTAGQLPDDRAADRCDHDPRRPEGAVCHR
jgi:hypothetical protein